MKIKDNQALMKKSLIDKSTKENPKLIERTLSDGRISLILEYYLGRQETKDLEAGKSKVVHHRRKESLNLYLIGSPRNPVEREHNKKTAELAKRIRAEREQELKQAKTGHRIYFKETDFLEYFQKYIDGYKKKDIRVLEGALRKFKSYLKENHSFFEFSIKPDQISKEIIKGFVDYLQTISKGEGANTTYQRFKKVVSHAEEAGLFKKNPCKGVVCSVDSHSMKKDILSLEELETLLSTNYIGQSPEVRRAFIFSLYTGLRFCDVSVITYRNIDYSNQLLRFEQTKTSGKSTAAQQITPLNEDLISEIIGKGEPDELIFNLPSANACNKGLNKWVQKAGINKHITWHSGRHSFAVNLLNNGSNIKTVSSLLGHSTLKHTEKYTRAVDELKVKAINNLPKLKK